MAPELFAMTVDARVRDLERDVRAALQMLASPHGPDRRQARAWLDALIAEGEASSAQAGQLISRAMTAAAGAALALRQDEKENAA